MAMKYLDLALTESVRRAQKHYYGHAADIADPPDRDPLGEAEIEFITTRDSIYLGTVNESGWPYIQHRGGAAGFLRVLNPSRLAFADYRGNRQLLTTGNLLVNDRVALFLMDYVNRARLKVFGHARVEDARTRPELVAQWSAPDMRAKVERIVVIDVVSYDWNCPKYITPSYSIGEVEEMVGPLKSRIAELEAQLRSFQHSTDIGRLSV
ncbi:MAG TPA: pyridoxamine 5'-phosphate oxidase family protein [Nitrospira sp.]|nr:pyridoxamine 5'-phosphate oxidase family protein [Nitrospira sp.]